MQTYSLGFGGSLFPTMKHTQQTQMQAKPYASLTSHDSVSIKGKNSVHFGADNESTTPTFDRLASMEYLKSDSVTRKTFVQAWQEICPDGNIGEFISALDKKREENGLSKLEMADGKKRAAFKKDLSWLKKGLIAL